MRPLFRSVLLLATTLFLASHVEAQVVKYSFTGNKVSESGPGPSFGETISGTFTLDFGASPTQVIDMGGQYAFWLDGNFTFNATTESGYKLGSSTDTGTTQFTVSDSMFGNYSDLRFVSDDTILNRSLSLSPQNRYQPGANGIATIPNPWILVPGQDRVSISEYNYLTGEQTTAEYVLTAFTPPPPVVFNIFINGADTGIKDVTYQGQSVNTILAGYAASARNHGDYVSSVTQLANDLKKAGLLTDAQKSTLTSTAAQSSVGKKK